MFDGKEKRELIDTPLKMNLDAIKPVSCLKKALTFPQAQAIG
jgi:hypothetical protein